MGNSSYKKDKKVAVIGSGPAGIVAAKEAKSQGFNVDVFEKSDQVGGVWRSENGQTWSNMKTNVSHYTTSFSDFPWDTEQSPLAQSKDVYEYLNKYVDHFGIRKDIHLKTKVEHVKRSNSIYEVAVVNVETGESRTIEYDFVIIAIGMFSNPYIPDYNGTLSNFHQTVIHSSAYKSNDERFKNKHVVVVGNAFSGTEIAADLVGTAASVTNVFRSSNWILPKMMPFGKTNDENNTKLFPNDIVLESRKSEYEDVSLSDSEKYRKMNTFLGEVCKEQLKIQELQMDPKSSDPPKMSISEFYVPFVKEEKIILKKGEIINFECDKIHLQDGSHIKADAIIFCTGYRPSLPFLDKSILEIIDFDRMNTLLPVILYKSTFHPQIPNMAFIAMFRTPYYATMELQARWVASVFKGLVQLPSAEIMEDNMKQQREKRMNKKSQTAYSYVTFADSIAQEIDALPDFEKLKTEDPELYNLLWNGPFLPAHYRIKEKNTEAINVIQEVQNLIIRAN